MDWMEYDISMKPNIRKPKSFDKFKEVFWSRVNKNGPMHPIHGQCWDWTARVNLNGYGEVFYQGKYQRSHRIAFELATGSKPQFCILHKCDRPVCINPDHLEDKSQLENIDDMKLKGRAIGSHDTIGTKNPNNILTEEEVRNILLEGKNGTKCKALSLKYNVHVETIRHIIKGMIWKHVVL